MAGGSNARNMPTQISGADLVPRTAVLAYGSFITATLNFLIIAFVL
jgi:large-conductance mechanosensitive channel